jgi:hypothetical protein
MTIVNEHDRIAPPRDGSKKPVVSWSDHTRGRPQTDHRPRETSGKHWNPAETRIIRLNCRDAAITAFRNLARSVL